MPELAYWVPLIFRLLTEPEDDSDNDSPSPVVTVPWANKGADARPTKRMARTNGRPRSLVPFCVFPLSRESSRTELLQFASLRTRREDTGYELETLIGPPE